MPANGPDILNRGWPILITFSFGCSFSSALPSFLHRIRVRVARRRRRHLPMEGDLGSQAGDLVAVFRLDVGKDRVGALEVISDASMCD